MDQALSRAKDRRPEVFGVAEIRDGRVELRCWPDKHWVGDVRRGAVLRVWDRRCKKYVAFRIDDLLEELNNTR
jgi:hypothetical protein